MRSLSFTQNPYFKNYCILPPNFMHIQRKQNQATTAWGLRLLAQTADFFLTYKELQILLREKVKPTIPFGLDAEAIHRKGNTISS